MTTLAVDIDFDTAFSDAVNDLASFIPKLIAFLVILVVGWFIAKLIRRIVIRLLQAIKFDQIMDRAGIGGPLERGGFADSGRFLAQIVYFLIMLLVLNLALGAFGDNAISDALDDLVKFIPRAIVAMVIIIITGVVANAVGEILRGSLSEVAAGPLMARLAVVGIWIIGAFAALDQLQFAEDVVDTLFTALIGSLSLILVIKFGVGGVWAARDRFWPEVYDRVSGLNAPQQPAQPAAGASEPPAQA